MRLVDADELIEHVWRDKLDSRELIAKMINNAPTVKEITTKIPINVFEKLVSQEQKTGHWINKSTQSGCGINFIHIECSKCGEPSGLNNTYARYCPWCGAKMEREKKE